MDSQKGKRITVKLKCPNPLFEEWLVTWRDQAVANDSKLQYSLNLALRSLRKYPLPFESGRECKILKGFGDRLCKMLDDRLVEHRNNGGLNSTRQHNNNDLPKSHGRAIGNTTQSNKKTKNAKSVTEKGTPTKQYIPQYRSGGYAILVTLHRQSMLPNYGGFLSKAELIQHGKDLTNSSFTKPDPGSRYTAWSSMRTLLTKELVSKRSNPPKFSLTEEGRALAMKLDENSIDRGDENISASSKDQCIIDLVETSSSIETLDYFNEFLTSPENDTFSVHSQTKLGGERIQLSSASRFIGNQYSEEELIGVNANVQQVSKYQALFSRNASSSSVSSCKEPDFCFNGNQYSEEVIAVNGNVQNGALFGRSASSSSVYKEPVGKSSLLQKYSSTSTCSTKEVPKASSKSTLKKYTSSSSVASTKSTVSVLEHFVMAPYSFDIILYVDNNETSGSSNSDSDDILVGLKKFGVKYEVKSLKVGDFTWICRDRMSDKELILPYIIERKRMDDLAHSIKDKRYYEQKFRLKKSGIENLTYLVESHGRNQHVGLPLQTLCQAATNTAVQENFFIKYTENMKETVEYLANFSKILIEMFKSKTLASCSKNDITPLDINGDIVSLMTFKEFNESSIKNKRMKVTDLFVKMLVQIKGMSVERALAVTQNYPTPHSLKEAYRTNSDSIGEKLLSSIKYGPQGKSLGATLSKTVHQVFTKLHY